MAIFAHDQEKPRREWTIRVYVFYAIAGAAILIWQTIAQREETAAILSRLDHPWHVIAIFIAFCLAAGILKFKLTDKVFVSFLLIGCMALVPILGGVLSAWIAIGAAIAARVLALLQIGPTRYDGADPPVEYARILGQFVVYGIPVLIGAATYAAMGGRFPIATTTTTDAIRIAVSGIVISAANNAFMAVIEITYGYHWRKISMTALIDTSIYATGVPYVIAMVFGQAAIGWGMLLGLAFSGVIINAMGRRLTTAMESATRQVDRIASLTNVGKAISLDQPQEELLATIYAECAKVVDVTNFSIALLDQRARELVFQFKMLQGSRVPVYRRPFGAGFNFWVVEHRQPLHFGRAEDQPAAGVLVLQDGFQSESWLGVPMIVRDRVIGVISVQTTERDAYTNEDMLLLTAIANQAAVAIEHASLYRDLDGKVKERTTDLEMSETKALLAEQRAIEASRAKSMFLANMSHEIRTPLNAILGFAQVMRRDTGRSPRDLDALETISRSGEHLLALINDVLSTAKIEAGQIVVETRDFDPHRLLAVIEQMFRLRASAKNLDLTFTVDPTLPLCVQGDEAKLRQVLINLLGNAIKFTNSGSVDLSATWTDGMASFDITDTGRGIAADDVQKLFQPFVQGETADDIVEGTGLGLAISRNFVRLMGGDIRVFSVPGKGSAFSFNVPLKEAAAPASVVESRRVIGLAPDQPEWRLLVVDDLADNRWLLEAVLVPLGFSVRPATDGKEAFDIWAEWQPHLIWMDIRMPVVDGYEATRQIRFAEEERRLPRCVIVALTASAFEHDRERIRAAGCDDFVAKPFLQETLFEKISTHLGVRWIYEEEPKAAPPESHVRRAVIPESLRERMSDALTRGDITAAHQVNEELRDCDAEMAARIGELIKGYRFDDVQALVDAEG